VGGNGEALIFQKSEVKGKREEFWCLALCPFLKPLTPIGRDEPQQLSGSLCGSILEPDAGNACLCHVNRSRGRSDEPLQIFPQIRHVPDRSNRFLLTRWSAITAGWQMGQEFGQTVGFQFVDRQFIAGDGAYAGCQDRQELDGGLVSPNKGARSECINHQVTFGECLSQDPGLIPPVGGERAVEIPSDPARTDVFGLSVTNQIE
jgi:hypothetical protein